MKNLRLLLAVACLAAAAACGQSDPLLPAAERTHAPGASVGAATPLQTATPVPPDSIIPPRPNGGDQGSGN